MEKQLTTRLHPWKKSYKLVKQSTIPAEYKDIIKKLFKEAYIYTEIKVSMVDSRKRRYVDTNMIIAAVINEYFKLTSTEGGRIFGKHHATYLHYIQVYENTLCLLKKNRELYLYLADLSRKSLYGKDGPKSYNIFEKDNKELRIICQDLINKNKALSSTLRRVKSIVNA